MDQLLKEIESFPTDDSYMEVRAQVKELVRAGRLRSGGWLENEPEWPFEILHADNGEVWHFCPPDHAFRGYLKRA